MPKRTLHRISPCSKALCVGLICLGTLFFPNPGRGSELRETPIVKAVRCARPSVVNIRGEKTLTASTPHAGQIEPGRRVNGMGTGVIIDPRGYIVTNFHVVDGVRQIQVTMADGKKHIARLLARDLDTDLAVIKINTGTELPVLSVGTSADLMPGEPVIAVGNAYGYEHTVTCGIISALQREVEVSDAQHYDNLIQTDASINPGNSGGPLLNIDGEMIGINVAVRAGAQGIGFAIPVDQALAVVAKLLASHNRKQCRHGVVLADDETPSQDGLAVVSVASNSPAQQGGLQPGDRIAAVGDMKTLRTLDFHRAMLQHKVGENVELAVQRGDDSLKLKIKLAAVLRRSRPPSSSSAWRILGLDLKSISPKQFRSSYETHYRGGLSVAAVRPNSPASSQGIRPGDVLVGMHIWETVSLDNVGYILKRSDFTSLSPLKFFILRGKETLYGYLPVATKTARRK